MKLSKQNVKYSLTNHKKTRHLLAGAMEKGLIYCGRIHFLSKWYQPFRFFCDSNFLKTQKEYFEDGEDETNAKWENLISKNPTATMFWEILTSAKEGDFRSRVLHQAIERYPLNIKFHQEKFKHLLQKDMIKEAVTNLWEIAEKFQMDPSLPSVLIEAAEQLLNLDQIEESYKIAEFCLNLDGDFNAAQFLMAKCLIFSRIQPEKAQKILEEIYPRLESAGEWLSFCLIAQGLFDEAIPYLKKVLARDPEDDLSKAYLFGCHFLQGKHQDAKSIWSQYTSGAKYDDNSYFMMAYTTVSAIESWDLKIFCRASADLHLQRAILYEAEEKWANVEHHFNRAMEADPSYLKTNEESTRIRLKLKQ